MIIGKLDVLLVAKIAPVFGLPAGSRMPVFGSLPTSIAGGRDEAGGLAALGGGIVGLIALQIVCGIADFIAGVVEPPVSSLAAGAIGGIRIGTA